MAAWVIWAIVAVGLAIGEILTPGLFFLGPVALAAVLAAAVAAAGAGVGVALIVFIAAAIASLAFLRPIARRHLHMPARLRTGAAALVGARGLALERIDAHGGRVKIGGEVWTARAFDEAQVIEPGTRVEIVKIEGATALVYE
jgi:membrane protein implicated in regulation of membrane protease activity